MADARRMVLRFPAGFTLILPSVDQDDETCRRSARHTPLAPLDVQSLV
jgi:hypothetical protein